MTQELSRERRLEIECAFADWFRNEYPDTEDRQEKYRMSSGRELMWAAFLAGMREASKPVQVVPNLWQCLRCATKNVKSYNIDRQDCHACGSERYKNEVQRA